MILSDVLQLSLRNLREAKLRTSLTTLGVSIGIASLVGMVSLGVGLQELTVGQFKKSGLFDTITVFSAGQGFGRNGRTRPARRDAQPPNRNSAGGNSESARPEKPPEPLDDKAIEKIQALPNVKEVYPNLRMPVEVKYGNFSEFVTAVGVPLSSRGEGVFQKITYGSFLKNETDDGCMMSLDFAHNMTSEDPNTLVGKELTLSYATAADLASAVMSVPMGQVTVQRTEKKYTIVGVVEREPGPNFGGGFFSSVMVPLKKIQEAGFQDFTNPQAFLRGLSQKPSYSAVTVKVKHLQDTEDVEKKIKDLGFNAFSINDALQGAKKAFIILDILLGLIGSIALAVASLGIVNTMVMSILERTREIGVMKAIGAGDWDIRKIFFVEASLIGVLGGAIGVVLGWSVDKIINFGANIYIQRQGGFPAKMFFTPWWLVAGGIGFSVLISLIAGSYPAARAARVDPIKALRHD